MTEMAGEDRGINPQTNLLVTGQAAQINHLHTGKRIACVQ